MVQEQRHRHLLLKGSAQSERFVSPSSGGKSENRLPARNRIEHGRALLERLRTVSQESVQILQEQHGLGVDVGVGINLEFESEPGFKLPTESLGDSRSHIELLAVRTVEDRTFATVFVPEGKLARFEKLVQRYLEENTRNGKPKNQRLVANIADIRMAALRAMWTDDAAAFPQRAEDEVWWEVWLRAEGDRNAFVRLFREQGRRVGLNIPGREIRFVERTVLAARGTAAQLTRSILLLNSVAEVRLLKETAELVVGLQIEDQREWANELRQRVRGTPANAPAICILDTGVNRAHPLLSQSLDPADVQSNNPTWTSADENGHGTEMAGIALFGDLSESLHSGEPVDLTHRLESVKILRRAGDNQGELYGDITREAIARAETVAPARTRVVCLAVTAKDTRDRGKPSAWSAAIDALASGAEDETRRLIVIAGGNVPREQWTHYPASNQTDGIHDPGQSWNALTVGAYSDKDQIDPVQYPGFRLLAPKGDLGPSSCTTLTWQKGWPLKPDIVLEGGNAARDPQGGVDTIASLDLLTTHFQPAARLFQLVGDTSAATALAAQMAATIHSEYPEFWPETVRALIVHSAEWTEVMRRTYLSPGPNPPKQEVAQLIRHCGFGVPSLDRALWSARNALTLIAQDQLQPFDEITTNGKSAIKSRDMNLHAIPWPVDVLENLGETPVELQVTLSYFIEPNPASRGWTRRYRYESHGLRFAVKRPDETLREFRRRVNQVAREEDNALPATAEDPGWLVGKQSRHLGSLHSDRWRGTAVALSQRGHVAIYPALGWWRERKQLERWDKKARYSLVISIRTPEVGADIYTPVANQLETVVAIPAA